MASRGNLAVTEAPMRPREEAPAAVFHSILFARADDRVAMSDPARPDCFVDLNLDQIVDAITKMKDEYDLKPFFHAPLRRVDAVAYRVEVMRDLEDRTTFGHIAEFAGRMRQMRQHLPAPDKSFYRYQKERWFLDAVAIYCGAVSRLAHDLHATPVCSRGLLAFRAALDRYAASDGFIALSAESAKLMAGMAAVKYALLIGDGGFTVLPYQSETDYSLEVTRTFEKFRQGEVKDYRLRFGDSLQMTHIDAKILEFVGRLYPALFRALETFFIDNAGFLDDAVATFDREIQFYVACLDYLAPCRQAGLPICHAELSDHAKDIGVRDGYDLALAHKLLAEHRTVVANDFELSGAERILVVSGPNQGGKTTFARMFGQMHYLASLGCPVPGRSARLFLFDRLFTHFEKEEDIRNLRGKLEDDLVRLHDILGEATSNSLVIMNEIFNSTTLGDAVFLGTEIIRRIVALDCLGVCVTFIDELASLGPKTVSMVSTVVPDNPALRTFKILRRPADGLSYAISLAEKYRLTYDGVKERIGP
jgi:DNA mismatch repair protein MutS